MTDYDRLRHDRSQYERPSNKYRCGRAAFWERPCAKGPGADGSCGGVAECQPFMRGGRFQCTRPGWAGGPCAEGPLPEGRCAHTRPPCAPRPTLRALRGRLSILGFLVVAALIGFTMGLPRSPGPAAHESLATAIALRAIDAGPLTSKHAASIQESDCSSCHFSHNTGAVGWWSAMRHGGDMNGQCRACHSFGPKSDAPVDQAAAERIERLPHNFLAYADRQDAGPSACEACHVEHRGAHADIKHLSDAQCNVCHREKITAFDADHPQFSPLYPYFERTAIHFNHASHIYDYFQRSDQKAAAPNPDRLCTSCHLPDYAAKATPPTAGYGKMCAGCHDNEIRDADIDVFVLPELPDRLRKPDAAKVKAACGVSIGDYETESDLRLTGTAAFLLGQTPEPAIDRRNPAAQETFAKASFDTIFAMAEGGADAFDTLFGARAKEWGIDASSYRLFDGLSLLTARQVACDWLAKGEFEMASDHEPAPGSWYADQHTLKYKPAGHADAVVRDWMQLAARIDPSKVAADDPRREIVNRLRRQLLGVGASSSDETAGVCAKCHGLVGQPGKDAAGPLEISWQFQRSIDRPFTNFTHAHHLDLVPPRPIREASAAGSDQADTAQTEPQLNQRCAFCHVLKRQQGDYDASFHSFDRSDPTKFTSNFASISKTVCQTCHNSAGFRQDCQTCHLYHLGARTHPRAIPGGGETSAAASQ